MDVPFNQQRWGECFLKDAKSRDPGGKAELLLILRQDVLQPKRVSGSLYCGEGHFPKAGCHAARNQELSARCL